MKKTKIKIQRLVKDLSPSEPQLQERKYTRCADLCCWRVLVQQLYSNVKRKATTDAEQEIIKCYNTHYEMLVSSQLDIAILYKIMRRSCQGNFNDSKSFPRSQRSMFDFVLPKCFNTIELVNLYLPLFEMADLCLFEMAYEVTETIDKVDLQINFQ